MRISDWSSDVCSSDLLERFPGGRGLRRTPMVNLEWALLADGVPSAEVYPLLRTEAGVARAFAKLDTIRDEIVWWEDASEQIGRASCREECVSTCRSRWSPDH